MMPQDTVRTQGPDNFFHFSAFFAYYSPIVQGYLTVNWQPILIEWSLCPATLQPEWKATFLVPNVKATLQLEWKATFLVPDAKGKDAFYVLEHCLSQHTPRAFSLSHHPSIGPAFFEDKTFQHFVEARQWVGAWLEDAHPLSEAFTAMHWFLLLPGIESLIFPLQGLLREQFMQFLVNVIFLRKRQQCCLGPP